MERRSLDHFIVALTDGREPKVVRIRLLLSFGVASNEHVASTRITVFTFVSDEAQVGGDCGADIYFFSFFVYYSA